MLAFSIPRGAALDQDWFRFIFGTVTAALTGAAGWFGHLFMHQSKELHDLKTRVSVLENKPSVDPLDYVKAITEMSSAIAGLTATIALLREEIRQLEAVIREKQEGRAR